MMQIFVGVISIAMIVIAGYSISKNKNILVSVNLLWWATFILLSFFAFNVFKWKMFGMFFIELTCFVAYVGSLLGSHNVVANQKKSVTGCYSGNTSKIILLLVTAFAFIGQLLALRVYGFSVYSFLSKSEFIRMNTQIAFNRYHGLEPSMPAIVQILLMLCYVAPLLGGSVFVYSKTIVGKVFSVSSIVPIAFGMLYTNTKAGFIASLMLFASGFLVSKYERDKYIAIVNVRTVLFVILAGTLFFVLMFIIMCIRVGDFSSATLYAIKNKLIEYALGQMEAFEIWFSRNLYDSEKLELGANTFMSIADKVGLKTRNQGVYGLIEGASSNIFTAYRGIITDFGAFGGLLFYLALGYLAGFFERVVCSCFSPIGRTILMATLFFFLYSFIISPWIYTSYLIPFIAMPVFSVFFDKNLTIFERWRIDD